MIENEFAHFTRKELENLSIESDYIEYICCMPEYLSFPTLENLKEKLESGYSLHGEDILDSAIEDLTFNCDEDPDFGQGVEEFSKSLNLIEELWLKEKDSYLSTGDDLLTQLAKTALTKIEQANRHICLWTYIGGTKEKLSINKIIKEYDDYYLS